MSASLQNELIADLYTSLLHLSGGDLYNNIGVQKGFEYDTFEVDTVNNQLVKIPNKGGNTSILPTPKPNSTLEDFKKLAEKCFKDYRKKYIKYFDTNKKKVKGKKTMLDTSPRVILVQNVGLFSVGDSLSAAKIAGDLTETNARVISSVEETSKACRDSDGNWSEDSNSLRFCDNLLEFLENL